MSLWRHSEDMSDPVSVPTALLTGTVGSGKTAVAAEMGIQMERRGLPVAIIDLGRLGWDSKH